MTRDLRPNRLLSAPLSAVFLRMPVTPNMITTLSLSLGITAGWLFSRGIQEQNIWGALAYQSAVVLDNCDGEIARAKKMGSAFGAWFDILADFVTDLSLFIGIALGALRSGAEGPVRLFAALCLSGALLHLSLVILEKKKGFGPAAFGQPNPDREARRNMFWTFFDGLREGESSWFVLILAFAGHSVWILWFGGVYMQVLWLSALVVNYKWIFREAR